MGDTLIAVRDGGSREGGESELRPPASWTPLIIADALADLRKLLLHREARATLVGISALRALLLKELVEHIETIGKDHKRLCDYIVPCLPPGGGSSVSGTGGGSSVSGAGGASSVSGASMTSAAFGVSVMAAASDASVTSSIGGSSPSGHGGSTHTEPSRFMSEFTRALTLIVQIPVEQLGQTVDSQGHKIDKDSAGVAELHTARSMSEHRLTVLEANYRSLDNAHRSLLNRLTEMAIERDQPVAAIELLDEAAREASSPMKEGENADPGDPPRKNPAAPMRQAAANVRKAPAPRKK